jgi:hypothetical protein
VDKVVLIIGFGNFSAVGNVRALQKMQRRDANRGLFWRNLVTGLEIRPSCFRSSSLFSSGLGAELAEAYPQPLFSVREFDFRRSRIAGSTYHRVIGKSES